MHPLLGEEFKIDQLEQGIEQLEKENAEIRRQNLMLQELCHKLHARTTLNK